jgi:hypothetical protein
MTTLFELLSPEQHSAMQRVREFIEQQHRANEASPTENGNPPRSGDGPFSQAQQQG